MSEVKPVIKTAEQRRKECTYTDYEMKVSSSLFAELDNERKELRAALEALQAENAKLKECLFQAQNAAIDIANQNAEQAKRIAVYEQFMRTCDKQAAEYELSAQKGTE